MTTRREAVDAAIREVYRQAGRGIKVGATPIDRAIWNVARAESAQEIAELRSERECLILDYQKEYGRAEKLSDYSNKQATAILGLLQRLLPIDDPAPVHLFKYMLREFDAAREAGK
jgi:hypothetical protein